MTGLGGHPEAVMSMAGGRDRERWSSGRQEAAHDRSEGPSQAILRPTDAVAASVLLRRRSSARTMSMARTMQPTQMRSIGTSCSLSNASTRLERAEDRYRTLRTEPTPAIARTDAIPVGRRSQVLRLVVGEDTQSAGHRHGRGAVIHRGGRP